MKTIIMFKSITIAFLIVFIVTSSYSQTQPENPGFEDWESTSAPGSGQPTVYEPVNWSSIRTSNATGFVNGLAPTVWEQSTDAYSGEYSVKLINSEAPFGIIAAGTITNGRIHATITGEGWAYTIPAEENWRTTLTQKPDSIAIWAKFTQFDDDMAQVRAVLHTGEAKIPDDNQVNYIATAEINIAENVTSWTRFSAPINYLSTSDPEFILFVLSAGDESASLGSTAYFDDIELIYNPVELDLTAFLQGPYNTGGQMFTGLNPDHIPQDHPYGGPPWNNPGDESFETIPSPDIVDWVMVEIRDAATASGASSLTSVGKQAGFLLKDGSVVGMDGTSRLRFPVFINNNLFVLIWQRDHLPIMSNYPLTKTGGVYPYDFSSSAEQNYGGTDAVVQLNTFGPSVWGMIGGDGDADKTITMDDKNNFWSIFVGKTGYLSSDYNMDGQIDNQDKNEIWEGNLNRTSQVPN